MTTIAQALLETAGTSRAAAEYYTRLALRSEDRTERPLDMLFLFGIIEAHKAAAYEIEGIVRQAAGGKPPLFHPEDRIALNVSGPAWEVDEKAAPEEALRVAAEQERLTARLYDSVACATDGWVSGVLVRMASNAVQREAKLREMLATHPRLDDQGNLLCP